MAFTTRVLSAGHESGQGVRNCFSCGGSDSEHDETGSKASTVVASCISWSGNHRSLKPCHAASLPTPDPWPWRSIIMIEQGYMASPRVAPGEERF